MNEFWEAVLIFFQTLSIVFGLVGVACSFYWYYRRPSVVVVPIVVTASLLILIIGQTLPIIWLAASGKIVMTEVTGVDCQSGKKHHIYYRFSVETNLINDLGSDGYGNTPCKSIRIGDSGMVTYMPNDPTTHIWGKAMEYLVERLAAALFVLVLVPIFSYFGVRKRIPTE